MPVPTLSVMKGMLPLLALRPLRLEEERRWRADVNRVGPDIDCGLNRPSG